MVNQSASGFTSDWWSSKSRGPYCALIGGNFAVVAEYEYKHSAVFGLHVMDVLIGFIQYFLRVLIPLWSKHLGRFQVVEMRILTLPGWGLGLVFIKMLDK